MSKPKHIRILRQELMEVAQKREIIADVLPVGAGFWWGESRAGKTGLVVRTAVSIAAGLHWGDRPVTKGGVLYVAGEAPRSVVRRLCATADYLNLSTDDLPIAMMSCPAKGLIDRDTIVSVKTAADQLSQETGHQVSLVVFDTLSTTFGDANPDDTNAATKAVKNMIELSEKLDCAVLAVHHPGKRGRGDMRGSSAFFANADFASEISRKGDTSIIEVRKNKDGPEGGRFAFNIAGRDLETASGLLNVQVINSINAWTKVEQNDKTKDEAKRNLTDAAAALALLADLSAGGSVSKSAWQEACFSHWSNKPSDNARKAAFSKARKKLIEDGSISDSGDTVTVTDTRNLGNSVGNTHAPDTVTVTDTTPPSMKGVAGNNGQSELPVHEPDGYSPSEGTSEIEGMVGRSNDLPRGCGTGSTAMYQSAGGIGNGNSGGRVTDAA